MRARTGKQQQKKKKGKNQKRTREQDHGDRRTGTDSPPAPLAIQGALPPNHQTPLCPSPVMVVVMARQPSSFFRKDDTVWWSSMQSWKRSLRPK